MLKLQRDKPESRPKEPTIGPGQHLARSVSIPDSKFEDVNLAHTEFDNVNLSSALFNNINFTKMAVSWVRMPSATFSNVVESEGVEMKDCSFPYIRFANCNLRGATFEACDLTGASIDGRPIEKPQHDKGDVEPNIGQVSSEGAPSEEPSM